MQSKVNTRLDICRDQETAILALVKTNSVLGYKRRASWSIRLRNNHQQIETLTRGLYKRPLIWKVFSLGSIREAALTRGDRRCYRIRLTCSKISKLRAQGNHAFQPEPPQADAPLILSRRMADSYKGDGSRAWTWRLRRYGTVWCPI